QGKKGGGTPGAGPRLAGPDWAPGHHAVRAATNYVEKRVSFSRVFAPTSNMGRVRRPGISRRVAQTMFAPAAWQIAPCPPRLTVVRGGLPNRKPRHGQSRR